jgi:acyl-coenzyme A thioesterase PaaI-like protein
MARGCPIEVIMNITAIPFHQYLGLEFAEPPNLLQLKAQPHHANHLGTIHASVLIALAEAGSGQFLMNHLSDGTEKVGETILPVIRRIEAKFHQGGQGIVYARCTLDPASLSTVRTDLQLKHRTKVLVPMQVADAQGTLLLSVNFDWFIQST